MSTGRKTEWHTRKWYKERFGVDPKKLNIPSVEARNPHYRWAASMLLWREEDVLPFNSDEGVRKYQVRKEAGRKAHETRKTRLVEWWKQVKTDNARVQEIVKRLWEIGERISSLHDEKQQCREDDSSFEPDHYWEFGEDHCDRCREMTETQDKLREERERLFKELQETCQASKSTIQLARKYYRQEQEKLADGKNKREAGRC
jgi:hypothetical protein